MSVDCIGQIWIFIIDIDLSSSWDIPHPVGDALDCVVTFSSRKHMCFWSMVIMKNSTSQNVECCKGEHKGLHFAFR